jgi:hypothetical protein
MPLSGGGEMAAEHRNSGVTVAEGGVHHSAHHPHGDMPAEHRNSGVTVAEGGVHHSAHDPHGDMPAEHHLGGVMVAEGGVHHSAVTMFSSHLTTTRKRLMSRSFWHIAMRVVCRVVYTIFSNRHVVGATPM